MSALNPVAHEVLMLADEVKDFIADEAASVLVWVADNDTRDVINAMFSFHNNDAPLFPGLVIETMAPCLEEENYSATLVHSLVEDFEESREDLEGEIKHWQPKSLLQTVLDRHLALLLYLSTIHTAVANEAEIVALHLHPDVSEQPDQIKNWLTEFIPYLRGASVRISLFGDEALAQDLSSEFPDQLRICNRQVDMNTVIEKTYASETEENSPRGQYKQHMVHAVTAFRRSDLDRAFQQAQSAFRIASKNEWPSMQMTSLLVYGNAILAKQDYREVVKAAQQAQSIAQDNLDHEQQQEISTLLVQSYFLEGTAQLTEQNWSEAVEAYDLAAPAAEKIGQILLCFEAFRMAAQCYFELEEFELAWERGQSAIAFSKDLPESLRREGSYLDLARLLQKIPENEQTQTELFQEQMLEWIGKDWRELVGEK